MYYKLSDFIREWKYESESTLTIFKQLTDNSLSKKSNANVRTPGKLAWHLVTTIGEMIQRTGLKFDAIPENKPVPSTAREIIDEYERSSKGMIESFKKRME